MLGRRVGPRGRGRLRGVGERLARLVVDRGVVRLGGRRLVALGFALCGLGLL
jgi:hypothetical protein